MRKEQSVSQALQSAPQLSRAEDSTTDSEALEEHALRYHVVEACTYADAVFLTLEQKRGLSRSPILVIQFMPTNAHFRDSYGDPP